jgi:broad specificity phosphatase PhoE
VGEAQKEISGLTIKIGHIDWARVVRLISYTMKLFFVRHAESVANAKLKDIHGKGDQLSPRGQVQANDLSVELAKHTYDQIYVSPSLRTIQTVAPYLRSAGRKATVLPICAETPGPSLVKIVEAVFGSRSKKSKSKSVEILPEHAELLVPHPRFTEPPVRHESLKDGLKRTDLLAQYLIETYGKSSASVLLVSHGQMGRQLIALLSRSPVPHPDNAQLWKLSGTECPFVLERINGRGCFGRRKSD